MKIKIPDVIWGFDSGATIRPMISNFYWCVSCFNYQTFGVYEIYQLESGFLLSTDIYRCDEK